MKLQDTLTKILKPIIDFSPINTFYYVRILDSENCLILSNKPEWVTYKIENKFTIFAPINLSSKKITYQLVPQQADNLHNRIMKEAEIHFQIFNPLDIFVTNTTYLELFSFAGHNNPEIINWYFNNLQTINRFVGYLQDKMNNLICDESVLSIHIKNSAQLSYTHPNEDYHSSKTSLVLGAENNFVELSHRENGILKNVMKGYTCKKISRLLNLSPRTVEWYVERIKVKLNCSTKDDLIDMLEKALILPTDINH